MDRDETVTLPDGTEIDVASALGDLARTVYLLRRIRDDSLDDDQWPEIDELLCDIPRVAELLEALADR